MLKKSAIVVSPSKKKVAKKSKYYVPAAENKNQAAGISQTTPEGKKKLYNMASENVTRKKKG